jgi:peptidoglycan/LPS O-acetylase OafA/YrhL
MKSHYEVLDGLRGTAALSVLLYHFLEIMFFTQPDSNRLYYAYLAVDFFFALSGYVLGHAYDSRMSPEASPDRRLDWKRFFKCRLIRLHPLAIVGVTFGLVGYIYDPFVVSGQQVDANGYNSLLILNVVLGLLMLPAPSLPNCFDMTHSLNSPAWSLTQEYLANVFYGLFGGRIKRSWLAAIWLASAAGLVWTSLHYQDLSLGWAWSNFWAGPLRVCVSFSMGLLIYRLNLKLKIPHAFLILSLALIAVFAMPHSYMKTWLGLYEVLCVLVVFPLLLMAGTSETAVAGITGKLCRLCGRLSYPVYIIHYPFMFVFFHWYMSCHPSGQLLWSVIAIMYVGIVFLAWFLLIFYDEPLRNWLTRKFMPKRLPHRLTDNYAQTFTFHPLPVTVSALESNASRIRSGGFDENEK